MTHAAVALDLGGTKTAGALITATGEILGQAAEPTPAQRGASAVMATAASVSRTLLDEAKERGIAVVDRRGPHGTNPKHHARTSGEAVAA